MPPTLSICIPTYNRASLLEKCLESIVLSAAKWEGAVELVISDNASSDETQDIGSVFHKRFPYLRYHRNSENIGPERNFRIAAEMASGVYVWLFGDDDRMTPEAVSTVLQHLQAGYDLVVMNFSVWSEDFSSVVRSVNIRLESDQTFVDRNDLLQAFGGQLGYISNTVIRKSLLLSIPFEEYNSFAKYGASFLISVYSGLATHCRAHFISGPLILNRGERSMDEATWDRYFVTGTSLAFESLAKRGYSPLAIRRAKHRVIIDYVIPRIVLSKTDNVVPPSWRLMWRFYATVWSFWLLCVPLLLAPRGIVRAAREIARLMRGRRSSPHGIQFAG